MTLMVTAPSSPIMAGSVAFDESAMQQLQEEQQTLLDTIDELRNLGLSNVLHLPQIVVVGDQCAGKSSVLEAISRVRFPIKDGICTRFPTELVLRQSYSRHTKVEVRAPGDSPDKNHTFNRAGFTKDDLPAIIEEAKQHMGITAESTKISDHVLRVEISGPDVPQLTLVDLPGFFQNDTESQDIAGIEVANRLAESYMRQENSIILAVISAQYALSAHKVLRFAKKLDPKRERTLGIITKPDKVDKDSNTEETYLRVVQNNETSHQLALGWHVLRNRAPRETEWTDEQRDNEERRFFESGVWSAISSQNFGIDTLRKKLSRVLLGHIQRTLPGLVTKIEDHISSRQTRLERLGDQRSSTKDVRKYLSNISSRYHAVAREAVQGRYGDAFFDVVHQGPEPGYLDSRIPKLRALVRDLNRVFYFLIKTEGAARHIQWGGEGDSTASGDDDEASANGGTPPETLLPEYLDQLKGYYELDRRVEVSVEALTDELDRKASENQGVEFPGSSNDRLALDLFRKQSKSWGGLAEQHVKLVTKVTREFTVKVMEHVVEPDSKTSEAIVKDLVTPYFDEKDKVLKAKVEELLKHYRDGYDPQPTMYDEFVERVTERRNKRLVKHMAHRTEGAKAGGKDSREALLDILKTSKTSKSDAEHTIDVAVTYYEVSVGWLCGGEIRSLSRY